MNWWVYYTQNDPRDICDGQEVISMGQADLPISFLLAIPWVCLLPQERLLRAPSNYSWQFCTSQLGNMAAYITERKSHFTKAVVEQVLRVTMESTNELIKCEVAPGPHVIMLLCLPIGPNYIIILYSISVRFF